MHAVQVVVRAGDSMEDLLRKVRAATTLGTWQATLTHWIESTCGEGLRAQWRHNTMEERLLGVSLTGARPALPCFALLCFPVLCSAVLCSIHVILHAMKLRRMHVPHALFKGWILPRSHPTRTHALAWISTV